MYTRATVAIHRMRINFLLVLSTTSIESIYQFGDLKSHIIIEDINGLIMCSNVSKFSDYAKKS